MLKVHQDVEGRKWGERPERGGRKYFRLDMNLSNRGVTVRDLSTSNQFRLKPFHAGQAYAGFVPTFIPTARLECQSLVSTGGPIKRKTNIL